MLTTNRDLMARARLSLKENWGMLIGITLTYFLIIFLTNAPKKSFHLINLLITGPLAAGYYTVFLALIRNKEIEFNLLFKGFEYFLNALKTYLLMVVYIILWSLLLIVPGIMAACSYALTLFLLADNPSIDAREAIQKSKRLMYGNRWKLCCLGGRYFGWFLLGIATCGIGFLWITPYFMSGFAHFYQDIIDNSDTATNPTASGEVAT